MWVSPAQHFTACMPQCFSKVFNNSTIYRRLLQPELESYELSALVTSMELNLKKTETFQSHPLDRMASDFKSVVRLQHHLERQLRPELQDPLRSFNLIQFPYCLYGLSCLMLAEREHVFMTLQSRNAAFNSTRGVGTPWGGDRCEYVIQH